MEALLPEPFNLYSFTLARPKDNPQDNPQDNSKESLQDSPQDKTGSKSVELIRIIGISKFRAIQLELFNQDYSIAIESSDRIVLLCKAHTLRGSQTARDC